MARFAELELEEVLLSLNPFIESHAEGSKDREVLSIAQAALLYIREHGNEEDFAKYYKKFSNLEFTIEVSREFATREEADQWLATGTPQHKEQVKIAGKGFMAVHVSNKWYFITAPLPEELKSPEWTDDAE